MKFKTIDAYHQVSDCKEYTISFLTDPNGSAFFRLWHKGEAIDHRRVPNMREDRIDALNELKEFANNHKLNKGI